jgi:hypothetical protein
MINRVTRPFLFCCALLACAPARAASTGSYSVEYDGFSRGLIALRLSASVILTPTGYSGRLEFHTAGLIGFMSHVESDSHVIGHFEGNRAVPDSFGNTGSLHGVDQITVLHWKAGNPIVDKVVPPATDTRSPVPQDQTAQTVDELSAMAAMLRQAGQTNHCEGQITTFDGRRLSRLNGHTVGPETPPASAKSRYNAPALRCDLEGEQLAGFLLKESEADQRRSRHGSAWLANLIPGGPPVPERVVFEHRLLGEVTLYLTSLKGTQGAPVQ